MWIRWSLKRFLLINLLLTIILTTFISIVSSYYLQEKRINETMDDLLVEVGLIFKKLAQINGYTTQNMQHIGNHHVQFLQEITHANSVNKKHGQYLFQAWDHTGKLLVTSAAAANTSLIGQAGFSDKYVNGHKWRVLTVYNARDNYVFALAEDYNLRKLIFKNLLRDAICLILFIYPASGLFIWLLMNSALKRIRSFANEVATRAVDRLDPVTVDTVPVEIAPLVNELNLLFSRVKQAFEREQQFSADAAHELHTPLAALRTHAQVALKTTNPLEIHDHLKKVITAVDRCSHVVQQLLTLYRLNPETITPKYFAQVELEKVALDVIAQSVPSALEKQIDIELETDGSSHILRGNATGLHILLRNLIDNAIRYIPMKSLIRVVIRHAPEELILSVIDNGQGIPEALQTQASKRFFRVLGTQTQGSGLGLAIVEQIAKLHRASIHLKTSKGGGLTVEVRFKKAKEPLKNPPYIPLNYRGNLTTKIKKKNLK